VYSFVLVCLALAYHFRRLHAARSSNEPAATRPNDLGRVRDIWWRSRVAVWFGIA